MSTVRLLLSLSAILACTCIHATGRSKVDRTPPASERPASVRTSDTKAGRTQAALADRTSPMKRAFRQGTPSLPPATPSPLPHRLADIDPPHGTTLAGVGWNGRSWPLVPEHAAPSPTPTAAGPEQGGHPGASLGSPRESGSRSPAQAQGGNSIEPEPSTCLLLALGLAIVWLKWRLSEWSRWRTHPG